ncbi:MAG: hypothetical protein SFH39_11435 [Candidatus Magnetobacterium sp. LHC-1]|nr:hypothetical protein [Nitrospirota bacterium]
MAIPMSVYLDKHTTYKSPAKPTIEDEINGREALSEFGRALNPTLPLAWYNPLIINKSCKNL